jgi:fructose-1,6-bisphosphatase/sedoheptulose 1,7-bisphosphatase-like protein
LERKSKGKIEKKKKTEENLTAILKVQKRLVELWVVVFDRFRKVYIASEMRAFIPLTQ